MSRITLILTSIAFDRNIKFASTTVADRRLLWRLAKSEAMVVSQQPAIRLLSRDESAAIQFTAAPRNIAQT